MLTNHLVMIDRSEYYDYPARLVPPTGQNVSLAARVLGSLGKPDTNCELWPRIAKPVLGSYNSKFLYLQP